VTDVVRRHEEASVRERSEEPTALLLLHAFPLDTRMWEGALAAGRLAGDVIAPDLAGCGGNVSGPAPTTIDAHADYVAGELDRRSITRATVIGLSMGGYVALALLRRHPRLVARLGLAGARAQADTAEARAAREANIALVQREGVAPLVERMLPKLLGENASPEVRAQVRRIVTTQRVEGVCAALLAMRDRPDSTPMLAAIAVPCSVIVGEHDAIFSVDDARQLATAIPGAELEVIADAGHLCACERPAAFAQAITRLRKRT
jgi:pimeloyl-ACP methyl ester carboxylesterase